MALAVATTSTYVSGGAKTSHAVTLPASIASGDLLLIFFANNNTTAPTTPTGWTVMQQSSPLDTYTLYARIADGTEGASVSITTPSVRAAATCYRVTGARNAVTSSEIAVSAVSDATTANPDPPSLTPSWGSDANLWIAVDFSSSGAQSATAWPTNYTANQLEAMEGTGVGCGVDTACRLLTAATEDPGTFTHSGSLSRQAFTVAVRPASTSVDASFTITESADVVSVNVTIVPAISFSIAETSDTVAINATAKTTASLAVTETSDTVAIALTAKHTVSFAVTETSDSVSVGLTAKHTASLAATETADTVAFAADPIQGVSFAVTETSDTVAASATVGSTASASFAITETADTAAFGATAAHTASLSATETSDTAALSLTAQTTAEFTVTESADAVALNASVSGGTASVSFALAESSDAVSVDASVSGPGDVITGGGGSSYWRGPVEPYYSGHTQAAKPPKKTKRKRKIAREGQQVILADDPVVQTGIIEVPPVMNAMAELRRRQAKAEAARLKRLRAIAQADDEWLMAM